MLTGAADPSTGVPRVGITSVLHTDHDPLANAHAFAAYLPPLRKTEWGRLFKASLGGLAGRSKRPLT